MPLAFLFFKGLPSNQTTSSCASTSARSSVSIAKVVNPLGTVTTITESPRESILAADEFAEEYSSGAYIHENCDESMFRPYVAVISGSIDSETHTPQEKPEPIGQKLIVPVIDGSKLEQQNREKLRMAEMKRQQDENVAKFERMSLLNKRDKTVAVAVEKAETKDTNKKGNGKNNGKDDAKAPSRDVKEDKAPEKNAAKKNDSEANTEKKSNNDTETVTVKLKKKGNKIKSVEPQVEPQEVAKKTERSAKNDSEQRASQDDLEFTIETSEQKIECKNVVEQFVLPNTKAIKSKKKSSAESGSSKESSIEKEFVPTPAEASKSKKKKQKKNDTQSTMTSSDEAKGSSEIEVVLKGSVTSIENSADTSFLMENIDKIDGTQCAEIQTSLLRNSVTATVSIRKGSLQEKLDDTDAFEIKAAKSGRKKKWSKESIEIEAVASNSPNAITDESTEFTYPDPSESIADLDNLSFKSTIDDQISMIPMESLQGDIDWAKDRTNDYDKLSDDAETGSGAQYSDCKSFQLIIDEPESDMRASDTNSSDEQTEDSSQSKSSRSEKTVDDEELQPLICSTTSEAAVDVSKCDTLPNDVNQSDSITQPPATEQNQQPTQKPANNTNNNKKKFKKKRR